MRNVRKCVTGRNCAHDQWRHRCAPTCIYCASHARIFLHELFMSVSIVCVSTHTHMCRYTYQRDNGEAEKHCSASNMYILNVIPEYLSTRVIHTHTHYVYVSRIWGKAVCTRPTATRTNTAVLQLFEWAPIYICIYSMSSISPPDSLLYICTLYSVLSISPPDSLLSHM